MKCVILAWRKSRSLDSLLRSLLGMTGWTEHSLGMAGLARGYGDRPVKNAFSILKVDVVLAKFAYRYCCCGRPICIMLPRSILVKPAGIWKRLALGSPSLMLLSVMDESSETALMGK